MSSLFNERGGRGILPCALCLPESLRLLLFVGKNNSNEALVLRFVLGCFLLELGDLSVLEIDLSFRGCCGRGVCTGDGRGASFRMGGCGNGGSSGPGASIPSSGDEEEASKEMRLARPLVVLLLEVSVGIGKSCRGVPTWRKALTEAQQQQNAITHDSAVILLLL